MEGTIGKSVQKKMPPGMLPAVSYKDVRFYHKATGGETSLDLAALVMPTEAAYASKSNPTTAQLLEAKVFFNQGKLFLSRSAGGLMQEGEYKVVSSSKINLSQAALPGEIFEGRILTVPQGGMMGVDARGVAATGTLLAGNTDINVGLEFKIGAFIERQFGEFILFVEGFAGPLFRNASNAQSSSGDGNYYEVDVTGGYGSIVRLNQSEAYDRAYVVVPVASIVQRPDGSRDSMIETLSGAVEKMKAILRDDFDYTDTELASNPSMVNMRQFGDLVAALSTAVAALQPNVGENLSALRQYNLTVTGNGNTWTTARAVGVPYRTLDGTWRMKFNISGSHSSSTDSPDILISGVVFRPSVYQMVSGATTNGSGSGYMLADGYSTNRIYGRVGTASTYYTFSGDIELNAKPTWVP